MIDDLEVKITSPKDCDVNVPKGERIPVEGTYSGNLAGRDIWVLIYASSDKKYYPQSSNACKMLSAEALGGRWSTTLFDLTQEQIDVVVVTDVDGKASQAFKDWLKLICDTGEVPPGFPASYLPDGLVEMDAITVVTK